MRTRRASYNFIAYASSFFVNAVVILITSPLLLEYLGAAAFGIWKTLQKVFDIASVADGRSGQVLKMIVARSDGPGSPSARAEAIGTAILIWLLYLPVAVGILVTLHYNLATIVGIPNIEDYPDVTTLFVFLSLCFLIAPFVTIPDAVLMGANLGYRSITIQVGGTIISNIVIVCVVIAGLGLYGVGLVTVVSTVLVAVVILLTTKRLLPRLSVARPTRLSIAQQAGTTIYMNLWLLIEKLILSVDMVLIAVICGPSMAASYSFMTYLPQLATSLLLIVGASVTPGLASMMVSDPKRGRPIVEMVRELILFGGTIFGCAYVLFNSSFVALWVGNDLILSQASSILIGLSIIQISHIRNEAQLQDTMLGVKQRVLVGSVGAIFGILLALGFAKVLETRAVTAILSGSMLGRLFLTVYYPRITNQLIGLDVGSRRYLVGVLGMFIASAGCSFFITKLQLILFLLIGTVSTLIIVTVLWYAALSLRTRSYISEKLSAIIFPNKRI